MWTIKAKLAYGVAQVEDERATVLCLGLQKTSGVCVIGEEAIACPEL
jgi:hypothetical protein